MEIIVSLTTHVSTLQGQLHKNKRQSTYTFINLRKNHLGNEATKQIAKNRKDFYGNKFQNIEK